MWYSHRILRKICVDLQRKIRKGNEKWGEDGEHGSFIQLAKTLSSVLRANFLVNKTMHLQKEVLEHEGIWLDI